MLFIWWGNFVKSKEAEIHSEEGGGGVECTVNGDMVVQYSSVLLGKGVLQT